MNRLSPLVARHRRAYAGAAPRREAAPRRPFEPFGDPPPTNEEWRLFLTSFLGGLVFFGTYLS
ncbi:MAG: hypothetical protein QOC65_748 [Sphingomonadales bacterium]|nr:hypothetical protein [Sphingomonadales bacterium]